MDKTYTLTAGATLRIDVLPESQGDGYRIESTLDCAAVDGDNHAHGINGGHLVDNMERGQFVARGSNWWSQLHSPLRRCKSAAIARRVAARLIVDADERVCAALARREAKLRLMSKILPAA